VVAGQSCPSSQNSVISFRLFFPCHCELRLRSSQHGNLSGQGLVMTGHYLTTAEVSLFPNLLGTTQAELLLEISLLGIVNKARGY